MRLKVKEAAARANVSPGLIYELCALNILPHIRIGKPGTRGCIRIEEADLDAFLASRKREGQRTEPPPSPKQQPIKLKHLHLPS
jgi:excisionase family DNA binding protein